LCARRSYLRTIFPRFREPIDEGRGTKLMKEKMMQSLFLARHLMLAHHSTPTEIASDCGIRLIEANEQVIKKMSEGYWQIPAKYQVKD
jgi:hypothetical protein